MGNWANRQKTVVKLSLQIWDDFLLANNYLIMWVFLFLFKYLCSNFIYVIWFFHLDFPCMHFTLFPLQPLFPIFFVNVLIIWSLCFSVCIGNCENKLVIIQDLLSECTYRCSINTCWVIEHLTALGTLFFPLYLCELLQLLKAIGCLFNSKKCKWRTHHLMTSWGLIKMHIQDAEPETFMMWLTMSKICTWSRKTLNLGIRESCWPGSVIY